MTISSKRSLDRPWLLRLAHICLDQVKAQKLCDTAASSVDQAIIGTIRSWVVYGAQSVVMPHTFAAALMASDARGALQGQRLPWNTFEIQVPSGLLRSSHGAVISVFVTAIPETMSASGAKYADHRFSVLYMDEQSWGVNTYRDPMHMVESLETSAFEDDENRIITGDLMADLDLDLELRLWKMIARLVAGTILTINTARIDKPEVYPTRELRPSKRDALQPNTTKVGAPLKIDCRNVISEYMSGIRRSSPALSFLVRGHWRNQAYGPQHTMRRPKWIHPFFKGEGPMVMRQTHIGGA